MKKIIRIALLGISLFCPIIAQATPITVTAIGQVYSSRDDSDFFGKGTGADTLVGTTITATWVFESENAGGDVASSLSEVGAYNPPNDWVRSTISIDTGSGVNSFIVGDLVTPASNYNDVLLFFNELGSSNEDRYNIQDSQSNGSGANSVGSVAYVSSISNNFITTYDPAQTFSWQAGDFPDEVARGSFTYRNEGYDSKFDYNLSSFIVTASDVPEPSIFILLGLGLSGLIFRRSKAIRFPV